MCDLKMVFIAGNEPFNQGSVGYTAAVQSAFRNNIMVNTIHCGSYEDGKKDLLEHRYLFLQGVPKKVNNKQ